MLIVVINNKFGYQVNNQKDDELISWLKENGTELDRGKTAALTSKPLAPDIRRDPDGFRCPLWKLAEEEYGEPVQCEYSLFYQYVNEYKDDFIKHRDAVYTA